MTSEIDITVGTAHVRLYGLERGVLGSAKTSVDFIFDDVLHAVTRAACAALGDTDAHYVSTQISGIREHLLGRSVP